MAHKIKLAIGIPNTGTIKAQTVFCLCRMLKDFPYEYTVLFKEGSILHANREELVKKAIGLGYTHLLFLDADMTFEKDAVLRLLRRKKEVIGANYHLRRLPAISTIKTTKKLKKTDTLIEVDGLATGFMLINLSIFQNLPHPWFFWETDNTGDLVTGEDMWFCRLAKGGGYKVWCDLTIKTGHIGDYIY